MPNINAQDLDVVRLTALFVAKNGRSFMTHLSQREASNYQFDFLRPQHSLYQFFSRLVDQYSELLNAKGSDGNKQEDARIRELNENIQNRFHILGRAKQRAEWVKHQEQQKVAKEEEAEAEKLAYAQIDWHDFSVLETIEFVDADEQTELAPPTSLSDLQSASLEQKAMMSLQPHNMRIEEAMPTEMDNAYQTPYQQQQYPQPTPSNMPPPQNYPAQPAGNYASPQQETPEETLIRQRREESEAAANAQAAARGSANAPMKIRQDYVPRAQARRGNAGMAICPNCKGQFPYTELEEHMRIELLDPRWREQRARADNRYSTTNLNMADVAGNLRRLASQRQDLFDSVTGEPLTEEEAGRRKKVATGFEGVSAQQQSDPSQGRQNMNIEEQLRHIQNKAKGA